ncbi:MAG: PfkB family carbohydrate kinase [Candidatus Omnitrophota bacterium]|jgi:sugar/nucleoside kinase (ribokinase family)
MSVLVLGTVGLDTIKTPFGSRKDILGGSASHFSMAARHFTDVHLSAVIGEDFSPSRIDFFRKKGIGTSSLYKDKGSTFRWKGEYKGSMNCAITLNTALGVLADFKPQLTEKERGIKYIFLANTDPDIQFALLGKLRSPRLVALDSMNYWISNKRSSLLRVLQRVDIFVANEEEARSLTGEANLLKAAKSLRSFGPETILIKKGEHGSFLYSGKFMICLPAFLVEKVVDPTGAGDTFAGGFMGYLAKAGKINQEVLKKAIAYGTVAASFNVEDFGVDRTAALTAGDLRKRMALFGRMVCFDGAKNNHKSVFFA